MANVPGGVAEISQPVDLQLLLPPPLSVVTFTRAVMLAPPATVTLVTPFSVTELIALESVNVFVAVNPDACPVASTRSVVLSASWGTSHPVWMCPSTAPSMSFTLPSTTDQGGV